MPTSLPPSLYSLQLLSYPFLPILNRSSRVDGLWLLLLSHLLKYVWYMCVYDFRTDHFVLNSQLEISSLREVSFLSFSTHKSPVVLLLGMCLQKTPPLYISMPVSISIAQILFRAAIMLSYQGHGLSIISKRHYLISDCLIFLILTFYLFCVVSWALESGVGLK